MNIDCGFDTQRPSENRKMSTKDSIDLALLNLRAAQDAVTDIATAKNREEILKIYHDIDNTVLKLIALRLPKEDTTERGYIANGTVCF